MKTDIERLIESAYEGLEPPPAPADLPAERARPARRGPRIAVAAVALAVLGFALARRGEPEGLADGGEELPVVVRPPTGVVTEGDFIRVRLTRDGRVLVPAGAEWQQVTLKELAERLDRAARDFDEKETLEGRTGFERTPLGFSVSRLRVDLLVDRDASWRHVQWLMTVCAERWMPRLAFVVGGPGGPYGLDAALPVDAGLPEVPHVRVKVQTVAGARYKFGDEESEELASVARYLAKAKKAAEEKGAPLRGEVKAGARTPFHEVAKLLAEFRQAGYENVDFYGTAVLDNDMREAAVLPKPETDWPVRKDPPAPVPPEVVVEEPIEEPAVPPGGR